MNKGKEYIGDGVYVRHDDFGAVWLTTENGVAVTNTICLEPEVYAALVKYHEAMVRAYAEMRKE